MADSKREVLRALCAEWQEVMDRMYPLPDGGKWGPNEFWTQVRWLQAQDDDADEQELAETVLHETRAGGINCPKCNGTAEFHFKDGRIGKCYMCIGGIITPTKAAQNHGYRLHNPGRQEFYLPSK